MSKNNVVADKTYSTLSELIGDLKSTDKRPGGMPRLRRCLRPSEFDDTLNLTYCKLPSDDSLEAEEVSHLQATKVIHLKSLKRVENRVLGRGKFTLTCKGKYLQGPKARAAIGLK